MELIAASRIVKAQQARQRGPAVRPPADARDLGAGVPVHGRPPAGHREAEPPPCRGPGRVQRPRPGRRLQRQRAQAGRLPRGDAAARGQGAGRPTWSGRKAVGFYRFRGREVEQSWTGFSEQPSYDDAKEVADALIAAFVRDTDDGGVDEIHVVHTEYVSALTQRPVANRVLPLVVEETDEAPAGRPAAAVRVRALRGGPARHAAAALRHHPRLRGAAGVGGVGVGLAPARHEGRDGQRGRAHQVAHASGELGPTGRDHPGDQRDRGRRRRAGRRLEDEDPFMTVTTQNPTRPGVHGRDRPGRPRHRPRRRRRVPAGRDAGDLQRAARRPRARRRRRPP